MIESAVGYDIAKRGCPDHCGNISLPYPFGIGANCYMNKGFEVSCSKTDDPPTLLITSLRIEVVDISLDRSAVTVKRPITCQNGSASYPAKLEPVNFTGSPFESRFPEGQNPALQEHVQDEFIWTITENEASQIPHKYADAFNCSRSGVRMSYAALQPQAVRNRIRIERCVCEPGFEGNPYLGCEGKLFSS
ncbi:hypothetical protein SLA2020_124960 [Shorea laevis]